MAAIVIDIPAGAAWNAVVATARTMVGDHTSLAEVVVQRWVAQIIRDQVGMVEGGKAAEAARAKAVQDAQAMAIAFPTTPL